MPRVVLKWKRTVRALLNDADDDLTSLVERDAKFKAKDPAAGIFSASDLTAIEQVQTILLTALTDKVTR